jgi:hypothetical protein
MASNSGIYNRRQRRNHNHNYDYQFYNVNTGNTGNTNAHQTDLFSQPYSSYANNNQNNLNVNRLPQTQEHVQPQNISDIIRNFLAPIEIFPTAAQIENATRIVRYSDIIRPNNISCPISLEPFRDEDYVSVIRFCNHIFNTNELNSWFQRNCRCPVCRYDIRNYNQNVSDLNYNSLNNNQPQEQEEQPQPEQTQQQEEQPAQPQNNNIDRIYSTNINIQPIDPILDVFTNYATNFLTDFIQSSARLDVSGNVYTYVIDMSGNRQH